MRLFSHLSSFILNLRVKHKMSSLLLFNISFHHFTNIIQPNVVTYGGLGYTHFTQPASQDPSKRIPIIWCMFMQRQKSFWVFTGALNFWRIKKTFSSRSYSKIIIFPSIPQVSYSSHLFFWKENENIFWFSLNIHTWITRLERSFVEIYSRISWEAYKSRLIRRQLNKDYQQLYPYSIPLYFSECLSTCLGFSSLK